MNKDKANDRIKELKRLKHCLEFDLTCNGIINYGPIMNITNRSKNYDYIHLVDWTYHDSDRWHA